MILFLWMKKWNVQVGKTRADASVMSAQNLGNGVFTQH
jgi:hypothetical protein